VETIIDFGQDGSKPLMVAKPLIMVASMKVYMAKTNLTTAFVPRLHSAVRIPAPIHGHD